MELEHRLGFGRKNDIVETPTDLYDILNSEFHFEYPTFDGLEVEWKKTNYVNPPYSSIEPWLEKAIKEKKIGNTSVFLIPARVNTKYWLKLVYSKADEIRFITGKVKFKDYDQGSPVPIAIVVYRGNNIKIPQNVNFSFIGKYSWTTITL